MRISVAALLLFSCVPPTQNANPPNNQTATLTLTVSGLSGSLELSINGVSELFTEDRELLGSYEVGSNIEVVVTRQPPKQTCTLTNGSFTLEQAGAAVSVTCVNNPEYTLLLNITNLVGTGASVSLDGGAAIPLTPATTTYTFERSFGAGEIYSVAIVTQPGMQRCELSNASGTFAASNAVVTMTCLDRIRAVSNVWNTYFARDAVKPWQLSGTPCQATATLARECVHAAELLIVELPNVTSCAGIAASDSRDVFEWSCDATEMPVRVYTTRMKKKLVDLLDAPTPAWASLGVSVSQGASEVFLSTGKQFWTNPVVAASAGMLSGANTIYVVNNTLVGNVTIADEGIALVTKAPARIEGVAGAPIVSSDGKPRLWIEGELFSSQSLQIGLALFNGHSHTLRDLKVTAQGLAIGGTMPRSRFQRVVVSGVNIVMKGNASGSEMSELTIQCTGGVASVGFWPEGSRVRVTEVRALGCVTGFEGAGLVDSLVQNVTVVGGSSSLSPTSNVSIGARSVMFGLNLANARGGVSTGNNSFATDVLVSAVSDRPEVSVASGSAVFAATAINGGPTTAANAGVRVSGAPATLAQVAIVNQTGVGLTQSPSGLLRIHDLVSTDSSHAKISLQEPDVGFESDARFLGTLLVNGSNPCVSSSARTFADASDLQGVTCTTGATAG